MAEPLGVKVQVGVNTTPKQFQKQIDILAKSVKADIQVNLINGKGSLGKDIGNSISKNISTGVKLAQVDIQKLQGTLANLDAQNKLLQTSAQNQKFSNSNIAVPDLSKQFLGAQRAIDMLNNGTSKGTQALSAYNQRVSEIRNSLGLFSKAITTTSQDLTNQGKQLSNSTGFERLSSQMSKFLVANPKVKAYLDDNTEAMANWQTILDKTSGTIEQKRNSFATMEAEMHRLGLTTQTTGQKLANLFKQHFDTALVMLALHQLQQALQTTITNVEELDKSLVELSKVSDLGPSELKEVTQDAYELGTAIGRTGREVLDATTIFKRAGYDLETSLNELSRAALIATNIGDNIGTVEEASSALIAVLRGFNLSDTDVISVIDKINEVSNNAPIDFDNITEGLQRVSGTLAQSGTTIDETIGLLTGGFAQLRNIEKVSSGLIMISQRLRGVGEDGESIEGLAPKVEEAFRTIAGIEVQQNGELRSTYDILQDLALVWDDLTTKERQYLGEMSAGNRQVTVLNAILQGWDDVSLAIDNSTNSSGSAIAENEKYKNSVEGIKNQIASLSQQFSNNLFSTDQYKPILTFFKTLLQLLVNITSNKTIMALLSGTAVVVGLKAIGAVLKTFGDTKLGQNINSSFSFIKEVPMMISLFKEARNAGMGFGDALKYAGVAASTAQMAIGALVAVISIITMAYQGWQQSFEKAIQKAKESQQAYDELGNRIETISSELDTANIRIEELQSKGSLSFIEQSELEKLQETTDELQSQLDILKEQEEISARTAIKDTTYAYNKNYGSQPDITSNEYLDLANSSDDVDNSGPTWLLNEEKNINALIAAYEYYAHARKEALETGDIELADSYYNRMTETEQMLSDNLNYLQEYRDTLESIDYSALTDEQKQAYNEIIQDQKDILETIDPGKWNELNFNEVINRDEFSEQKQELIELAEQGKLTEETLNSSDYADLIANFERVGISSEEVYNQLQALYGADANLSNTIESLNILASAFSQITDQEIKDGLQDLYERLSYMNSEFQSGNIDASEYFNSIQSGINSIDWGNLEAGTEEMDAAMASFSSLVMETAYGIETLQNGFREGTVSMEDYLAGLIAAGENQMLINEKFLETNESMYESTAAYDAARQSIEAQNQEIQNSIDIIGQYSDSLIYLAEIGANGWSLESFGDEAQLMAQEIANSLYMIADAGNTAAQSFIASAESQYGTLYDYLLSGSADFSQAAQIISQQANIGITGLMYNVGNAISSLGSAIKNFDMTIDITPTVSSGSNIDLGPLGSISLPKISYEVSTSGSGIDQIGSAIEDIGFALSNNRNDFGIQLGDFSNSINKGSNALHNLGNAASGAGNATKALNDELKRQKEILKEQEDAINDLLEMTIKMIKKEKQLQKEALQDELDGYKKIIDARKELLRLREEEYDYQKELAEANKEVSEIESELLAIQFDDSEAAQRRRLELQEQLTGATNSLNELQHDREVELSEDALDTEYERFEELQKAKIEAIDRYLDMEGQIRQDAIALIEARTQEFYNRLLEWNRAYNTGVDIDVVNAWNNAYNAMMAYNNGQINVLSTLAQITARMKELENAANAAADAQRRAGSGSGSSSSSGGVSERWGVFREDGSMVSGPFSSSQDAHSARTKAPGYWQYYTVKKYARGLSKAKASHLGAMDEPWLGDEMFIKTANGSRLKRIEVGDSILPADFTKTLTSFAKNPMDFIKNTLMGNVSSVMNNNNSQPTTIDARLIVQGNIADDVLPKLQDMMEQQRNRIFKEMQGNMNLAGYRKSVTGT